MSNATVQRSSAPPFTGWERVSWLVSTVALAAFYAMFAILHFQGWIATGRLTGLGLVAQETLVVALFVLRRRATHTTHSPVAWVAAGIGAFGVLALRPLEENSGSLALVGSGIQVVAALGYVASLGFLGRSFGVVAAHRGVRTGGPYAWVRHPVYACYAVANLGYLLENPTAWNLGVIVVQGAFQLVRIVHEEAVLSSDPAYVEYRDRVRWRLLPFVY